MQSSSSIKYNEWIVEGFYNEKGKRGKCIKSINIERYFKTSSDKEFGSQLAHQVSGYKFLGSNKYVGIEGVTGRGGLIFRLQYPSKSETHSWQDEQEIAKQICNRVDSIAEGLIRQIQGQAPGESECREDI